MASQKPRILSSGLPDDGVQPPEVFCGSSPKSSRLGLTLIEITEWEEGGAPVNTVGTCVRGRTFL